MTDPFLPIELTHIPGTLSVAGTGAAQVTVQQGPSARVDVKVSLERLPFAAGDGPHSLTAETSTHLVRIDRAWFANTTNSFGVGGPSASATLQIDEAVLTRKKPSTGGPLRATFVLQGCAFFFSGRASSWLARFAGRDWTLTLRREFFPLDDALKASEYSLLSCALSCSVADMADAAVAEATVHNVCDLLSYATDVEVRLARVIVVDADPLGPLVLKLNDQRAPGRPVLPVVPLDLSNDGGVKLWLEHCVDRFAALRGTYCLNNVMCLARLARRAKVVTVKGLLAANSLEVLRYNYGHNVLVPNGRAVARDDDLHWPPGHPKQGKKMSFMEILTECSTDHLLTGWQGARFRDLRNAVVHTGELPGASLLDKYREAIDALHFVDTAVLAILDWDAVQGRYLPCNAPQDPRPGVVGNNVRMFTR